jgi:hypothetical protein
LRAFLDDPELEDLHPLRRDGTKNYLWWTYERLDDLRPLFAARRTVRGVFRRP